MFVPVNGNAFTRKKREQAKDAAVLARHQQEKEIRSQTLHEGYRANQMIENGFKELAQPRQKLLGTSNTTTSNKFIFDDGEPPEEMNKEKKLNQNNDTMLHAALTLNAIAQGLGEAIDEQNDDIGRVTGKVSRLPGCSMSNCIYTDDIHRAMPWTMV